MLREVILELSKNPVREFVRGASSGGVDMLAELLALCVARYDLQDDAASTVVVDSVAGANCALVGGGNTAAISVAGPTAGLPKSLQLNGSSHYISRTGHPLVATTDFTECAWVYLNSYGGFVQIIGNDSVQGELRMAGDGRTVQWAHHDGVANDTLSDSVQQTTGSWFHVAITFNATVGNTAELFVNGISVGTLARFALIPFNNLLIGSRGGGLLLPGRIAGVRFWNFILSPAQIAVLQEP